MEIIWNVFEKFEIFIEWSGEKNDSIAKVVENFSRFPKNTFQQTAIFQAQKRIIRRVSSMVSAI